MRRNYSVIDLIRYAKLSKERAEAKPIDLIKEYDKLYPELTAKQQWENIKEALGKEKAEELERALAKSTNENSNCNKPHVTHRCNLKRYGDVEMKCVKCGYVTWRDDSKTTQELIEQMVREGYPLPDCSNGG
jgi:myo-inositol-1-phosphate synthase